MKQSPLTITFEEDFVVVNGVKYVKEKQEEITVSIYLLKDNHSSVRVYGANKSEIRKNVSESFKENPDADMGVIFVLRGTEEIERLHFKPRNHIELIKLLNKEGVREHLLTNIEKP